MPPQYLRINDDDNAQKSRRGWRTYLWDTWDKSPQERHFLNKLDSCLLSYAALSYFSKYIDQQNLTNAYVSGMKEDLGLQGNQLNYITTAWTIGYLLGQIPANLLLTRIRPSIWVPTMEVIWSVLTMFMARAGSFGDLVVLRFFIGLAESSFYPAIQYVIGSWYKKDELGKRSCIFHAASAFGPMCSGILQTVAYNHLRGVWGLTGWQWLFIIDGIITVPIGLLGYLIMPDLPHTTRPSFILTEDDLAIAKRRMDLIGRRAPQNKLTKAKVKGFFKTWHIYTLAPLYVFYNNASGSSTSMIFWLKSFNTPGHEVYTIGQINMYPIGQQVVQVITTLGWAWWSDAIQLRWPPIFVAGTWGMINCIILASTPLYTNVARRWAVYYMTTVTSGLSGIIMSWISELTGEDSDKRAFVVALCNTMAYTIYAWLPLVIFPQVEQPRVLKGNIVSVFILLGMILSAAATMHFQERDSRRERRGSSRSPSPENIHDNYGSADL